MTEITPALIYYCPNLEATRVFYGCLGLSFKPDRHGDGPEHYVHSFGNFILELYPTKRREGSSSRDARQRLSLLVDELDTTLQTLRELNPHIEITPPHEDGQMKLRYVFLVDPDGRELMLMERAPTIH